MAVMNPHIKNNDVRLTSVDIVSGEDVPVVADADGIDIIVSLVCNLRSPISWCGRWNVNILLVEYRAIL